MSLNKQGIVETVQQALSMILWIIAIIAYLWISLQQILNQLLLNHFIIMLKCTKELWHLLRKACACAPSLIRAFANPLDILWALATDWTSFGVSKLKRGCKGLSEWIHVKMPHCRKSYVKSQFCMYSITCLKQPLKNRQNKGLKDKR